MSGVVVAISAFVALVSFGAGTEENIERQYQKLGLFTTMQVYPKSAGDRTGQNRNGRDRARRDQPVTDTTHYPALDRAALDRLALIPGVNLVYPYDAFNVTVKLGDSTLHSRAQSLTAAAMRTKLFSNIKFGKPFANDSSRQAIISDDLLKSAVHRVSDSIIGKPIVISVHISTIDSGFTHILSDRGETILSRLKKIKLDSLLQSNYRNRVIRTEVNAAAERFMHGFTSAQQVISDTLTVCGVREGTEFGRMDISPVIIPFSTAQKFSQKGFSGDPTELVGMLTQGKLFPDAEATPDKSFEHVTLDLDPHVLNKTVRDSVEAMGYRVFSFAAEFDEIQKAFFYVDLVLSVVGLIALFTASLGIVNTMVMSISERKKEIGILKSLGADESEIRLLFLVESGTIGLFGTVGGILFGWIITRIVSIIGSIYMENQGLPKIDFFALPFWLIFIALGIGVGVSILAGLYPAARAARVDPVQALRNE